MVDEVIPSPKMEKIEFSGRLITNLASIKDKLSKIPLYSVGSDPDSVTIARVESRNIRKLPYLFYMISVSKDKASAVYSIPQDTSSDLRRASILRAFCSALAIVSEDYQLSQTELLQYIDSTTDKLISGMSQSYSTLFNKYDAMLDEYRALKRLNIELSASNRNLTIQAAQLDTENKVLKQELEKLQKYSDESLMSLVEDWVSVHNNTIDVDAFAKAYSITAPRVEEILDKMVSTGYLEAQV